MRRARAPNVLELELEQVGDRYEILRHGGGGQAARMVCCAVRFDHPAARNLTDVLPPVIHVAALDPSDGDGIQTTVRLMAAEAGAMRPGGEALVTRLADILVVQTIRSWIDNDPVAQTGWLGALQDPLIGHAIALIHAHPGRDWTVASLADELAMSRSAFAARFTERVGEPAMRYVARWRINVAGGSTSCRQPCACLRWPSRSSPSRRRPSTDRREDRAGRRCGAGDAPRVSMA